MYVYVRIYVYMYMCMCVYVRRYVRMSDVTSWLSEELSSLATGLEPNLVFPLNLWRRIIGSLAEVRTQYCTTPRWRCKPHLSALVGLQKSNLGF